MKLPNRCGAALVLAVLASSVNAADISVEWDLPFAYVDGSQLSPIDDLAHTVVEYGSCGVDTIAVVSGAAEVPSPQAQVTIAVGAGPLCVRAYVVSKDGVRSAYSGTAKTEVPPSAPGVPAAPTVLRLVWLPEEPPSAEWVVLPLRGLPDRPARSRRANGTLTTTTVGHVAAGAECDCSETATRSDTTDPLCSVSGQEDARTGLALPSLRPDGAGGAFVQCAPGG